jgi:transposase
MPWAVRLVLGLKQTNSEQEGGETIVTTTTIVTTNNTEPSIKRERIYVGIDVGYRQHVAAASPLSVFNAQRNANAWRQVKIVRFGSDAAGFTQLQRYLDKHSSTVTDFLVLLEPTGGYYALGLILYLLGKGYRVLQVENRAVKDYREKVFGSETKADEMDARLMARMGFLHELVGEEFSIRPVHLTNPDAAALKVMVGDLNVLQKEITRRRNQLQQITAATFPELKTFFRDSTASPTARALLANFPTPQDLAAATTDEVGDVLRAARSYGHAKRAAELQELARGSAGVRMLTQQHWRQSWIIKQLDVLDEARRELVEQVQRMSTTHRYALIIESLPVKSPIWTATLIAVIGDISRFRNYAEFRAYLGWSPQVERSGSSLDSSKLAKSGVRLSRKVLGQMVMIMLTPAIRTTPFRAYYERLTARGMRPAKAMGHVAGKLSGVLYSMLKTTTPYDEVKHRRALGLAPLEETVIEATVEAPLDLVALSIERADLLGEAIDGEDR